MVKKLKQDVEFALYEIVWMNMDGEAHIGILHNGQIYDVLGACVRDMSLVDNQMCVNVDGKAYPIISGSKGIGKASEFLIQDASSIKEYMLKRKFQKLYSKKSLNLDELKEYNLLYLEIENYGKEDNVLNAGQQKNSRKQAKMKIEQAKRDMEKARKEQEREDFLNDLFSK